MWIIFCTKLQSARDGYSNLCCHRSAQTSLGSRVASYTKPVGASLPSGTASPSTAVHVSTVKGVSTCLQWSNHSEHQHGAARGGQGIGFDRWFPQPLVRLVGEIVLLIRVTFHTVPLSAHVYFRVGRDQPCPKAEAQKWRLLVLSAISRCDSLIYNKA